MTVDEAARALSELGREDMLAAIERAVGALSPEHAGETGTLLRLVLDQDLLTERLAGEPARLHSEVSTAYRDLEIRVAARRAVLAVDLLDSRAVAELVGAAGTNRRDAASELRRRGTVVGVPVSGRRYAYPAFQFDPVEQGVIGEVAAVNVHLGAAEDPWGVASWWVSAHPRLDGLAPRELLGTDRAADLLVLAGVRSAA